jgi:hypothetical protein
MKYLEEVLEKSWETVGILEARNKEERYLRDMRERKKRNIGE